MALQKKKVLRGQVPDVIKFFFDITGAASNVLYTCKKCKKTPTQQWKTGNTNLYRHLESCIGKEFRDEYEAAIKSQQNRLGFAVVDYVSERDLVIYKWLSWVIMRDMPFSEVDNEMTRELAGLNSQERVSSKSIRNYIMHLVALVESEITRALPDIFAVKFDGWKDKTTHYIAVLAVYMHDDLVQEVLLGFSPPLDEKSYTAEAHRDLLSFVLGVFHRTLDSVVALIANNCATNKAAANLLGVPLLGCAAHKFNLAIKRYVKDQPGASDAIEKLSNMCTKACNLKAAAALRELTELVVIRNNDTRWSSTYRMLERFFQIEDELRQVHDIEVPRHSDLELNDVTVASARGTFDELLEDYPELSHYLAQDASIVHDPVFESALVKVQNDRITDLSEQEKTAMHQFEIPQQHSTRKITWGNNKSYFEQLQDRKRRRIAQVMNYADLTFMHGTSASVERLFSAAKYVMSDRRCSVTPVMFEAILFLKTNNVFWDSKLVAMAIRD